MLDVLVDMTALNTRNRLLRCIELTGKEVIPALREMGDELGLHDPFELDSPVSLKYTPPEQLRST